MDPNLCFEYQQLMSRYRNVTDKQQKHLELNKNGSHQRREHQQQNKKQIVSKVFQNNNLKVEKEVPSADNLEKLQPQPQQQQEQQQQPQQQQPQQQQPQPQQQQQPQQPQQRHNLNLSKLLKNIKSKLEAPVEAPVVAPVVAPVAAPAMKKINLFKTIQQIKLKN